MYREKSKKHAQTQHLYDTLKKRILMSQVETAASDNVAQTLKSMAGGDRPGTYNGTSLNQTIAFDRVLRERPLSRIPVNEQGVEQLHRHQRQGSGSGSHHSVDAATMPPPDTALFRQSMRFLWPRRNGRY